MPVDERIAIAKACYLAYARKDRAAIEGLLAKEFHFTSPLDNRLDREAYFKRCWPNSAQLEEFKFLHLAVDGDRVFVTYEVRTRDLRRFRNTEILTIRAGQIVDAEVYFGWSVPHPAPPGRFIDAPAR